MTKGKDGWYPLQRSITEGTVWNCGEPFGKRGAYIDLLLMANYEEKKVMPRHSNDVLIIHKGETLTSFEHLAKRWGWSRNKTIAYIDQLEEAGLIERKSYNFGTVLTLVEYSESGNQQTTSRTTNETTNETTKSTSGGTTNGTTSETTKGLRHKKDKKDKERIRKDKESKEINKDAKRPGVFSWEGEPE